MIQGGKSWEKAPKSSLQNAEKVGDRVTKVENIGHSWERGVP